MLMSGVTLSKRVGPSQKPSVVAVEVLVGVADPAVDDQFGAGVDPGLHVAGDLVPVLPGDQRPHVGAAAAVTGAQGGHPLA